MTTQAPFPVNAALTAVALTYRNDALIADMVMPRVPVATDSFKYFKRNKSEHFTVPDTKLGRKSEANEVEFGGTEVTDAVQGYGLKDVVPLQDVRNAMGLPFDPMADATEGIAALLRLDREIRVAGAVFNATNYAAANKVTLSGTGQWSHASSNPLTAMLTAFDTMLMRPNKLVLGQAVWTTVRTHPRIIEAVRGTGAGAESQGTISRQQLAELLEIDEVIVGSGWVNTAKKGATAAYSRCWGKLAAALHVESVGARNATTFGFTAEAGGGFQARDWFDPKVGIEGAQVVQVTDLVKEVITADDLGYLWSDAIA